VRVGVAQKARAAVKAAHTHTCTYLVPDASAGLGQSAATARLRRRAFGRSGSATHLSLQHLLMVQQVLLNLCNLPLDVGLFRVVLVVGLARASVPERDQQRLQQSQVLLCRSHLFLFSGVHCGSGDASTIDVKNELGREC
jgi:hypothetical protein